MIPLQRNGWAMLVQASGRCFQPRLRCRRTAPARHQEWAPGGAACYGERAGQTPACSMPDDHLDLIASSFAHLFAIARSALNRNAILPPVSQCRKENNSMWNFFTFSASNVRQCSLTHRPRAAGQAFCSQTSGISDFLAHTRYSAIQTTGNRLKGVFKCMQ